MKKMVTLLMAFAMLHASIAVVPVHQHPAPLKATEILLPIGKTGQHISLADFAKLKPAEYERLANVKLGFFDRIAYKMAMKKLKRSIAADGTITNKKLQKSLAARSSFTDDFHLGGFALGLLVGLIGVLIAYLINDDKKTTRVKWAWYGLVAWLAIVLIAVVI